ncbi:MAG: septal ring lytic transglycosylase RlpA family protein [Rhodopila sp.]|nr:septal ring lytic transglycosylase RlpA family protein [Rhodopila sp.]
MRKHFAVALVATSTLLNAASHSAFARGTSRNFEPPLPGDTSGWLGESGTASYYGPAHQGRRSASGLRFDQKLLTAAHPWLPFGTKVKVTLAGTRRSVIVTVTDRLYSNRRVVDLSVAAARQLGMINSGIAEVTLAPA